jgi:hypothetical protein
MNFVLHQGMKMESQPLTPSLSPSDGERVSVGRVRGISTNILRFISLILIVSWNGPDSSSGKSSCLIR